MCFLTESTYSSYRHQPVNFGRACDTFHGLLVTMFKDEMTVRMKFVVPEP